ncbi:VOC family protein (plasmid) [Rhizobium laguerreae]|uniref:VOC family protein n=1 Tax=Rhizobium laguerreae TaxID=1076926 RepID=UPI00143FB45B|nr:VOC family protein [Rhizobium laguerreae]NNH85615.1 VOC family protein [Rhizobium laguerreae]UFW67013.1 VOC family protein [Rhizobium laguerreae]
MNIPKVYNAMVHGGAAFATASRALAQAADPVAGQVVSENTTNPAGTKPAHLHYGTGFHHINVWAFDMDETIAFYEHAFGFRLLFRWEDVNAVREQRAHFNNPRQGAHLDMGDGQILELSPAPKEAVRPNDGVSSFHHIGLRVSDLETAYSRALSNGAAPYPLRDDMGGVWDGPTTITLNARPPFKRSFVVRAAHVLGPNGEIIELFEA